MFTANFWKDAIERGIRTAAQVALALIPTTAVVSDGGVDWKGVLMGVGIATGLSFVTSLLGSLVGGNSESPAFVAAEPE